MSTRDTIARLNQIAAQNEEKLKKNPFSDTYGLQEFDKQAEDYGRPPPGSKTEKRGVRAGDHVCREILYLCELIDKNAEGQDPNKQIKFGRLFNIYSFYSDKLVGMLIRARKYGLLHFEGEMLYQRQDDEKMVTMLMSFADIVERMRPSGDPKNCVVIIGGPPPIPEWLVRESAPPPPKPKVPWARKVEAPKEPTTDQKKPAAPTESKRKIVKKPKPNTGIASGAPSFCMTYAPRTPAVESK